MPHYRNLTANGKFYQYNIGKRFIAIKSDSGTRHVPKADIGFHRYEDRYVVTPGMIRDYLNGNLSKDPSKYFSSCSCQGVKKKLVADPFDAEIREKVRYCVLCAECYENSAMNI